MLREDFRRQLVHYGDLDFDKSGLNLFDKSQSDHPKSFFGRREGPGRHEQSTLNKLTFILLKVRLIKS